MFLRDTSVHVWQTSPRYPFRGRRANLRVLPVGPFSRACSTTLPTGKVGRRKKNEAKEVPLPRQDSDLVNGVVVVQHQKRPGGWDNLALHMANKFVVSKHPEFNCSNIPQSVVLVRRKEGRGAGAHCKTEPENHGLHVHMIVACYQLCYLKATRCQRKLHSRIESGRSHSVSSPQTTSLRSGGPYAPPRTVDSCTW